MRRQSIYTAERAENCIYCGSGIREDGGIEPEKGRSEIEVEP